MKGFVAKRLAFSGLLVAGGFACGVALADEEERFFPRKRIVAALRKWKDALLPPMHVPVPASVEVQRQRTKAAGEAVFHRDLETALLPLRVTGYKLGAYLPVARFAGGIAAVGNAVVAADRLGHFFAFRDGQWTQLSFPNLPVDLEGFLRQGPLTPENFRVHDVEYLPEESLLAVSHEVYDSAARQTRLAVSLIGFERESLQARGEWRTLWRGDVVDVDRPPASPGAGRLVAGPARSLYLTTIDYIPDDFAHPTPELAQDSASTFGKILRLDLDTGRAETVSIGHRNPQGLTLTRAGELVSAEHGPGGGDEVNKITPGANYGWPRVTFGTEYDSYQWPGTALVGRHDNFVPPLFAWVPAVAPSNLMEVQNFHARWDGDLLVGSLKAGSLFRLRREGDRVLYSEPIYIGERIRDLSQLEDGTIALWTDNANLLLIEVDVARMEQPQQKRAVDTMPSAIATCLKCHHFGPTNPAHPAPTLSNLVGRPIASDHFASYSRALQAVGGVWNADRLRDFLSDPSAFAEGTTMPKPDLQEYEVEAVLHELQKHTGR